MGFTLILAISIGFLVAVSIGANDVANTMSPVVGSKAISIKTAIIIASVLEFVGVYLFGKLVIHTIKSGIVNLDQLSSPSVMVTGGLAVLIATGLCVFLATFVNMPVSTTHAVVGGMVGFGLMSVGIHGIYWGKLIEISSLWILSPILGGLFSYGLYKVIHFFVKGIDRLWATVFIGALFMDLTLAVIVFMFFTKTVSGLKMQTVILYDGMMFCFGFFIIYAALYVFMRKNKKRIRKIFKGLQIFTASYLALAHGANDVANAIGPLAAVYAVLTTGVVSSNVEVPKLLLIIGGVGISFGVAILGKRVMKTVGERITKINTLEGFTVSFTTATLTSFATFIGIPVSTTHTVVGSVVGVGIVNRKKEAINLKIILEIILSWVITIPLSVVLSMVCYEILKALHI